MELERFKNKIYEWYVVAFEKVSAQSNLANSKALKKFVSNIDRLLVKFENDYLTMADTKIALAQAKKLFNIYISVKRTGVCKVDKKYEEKLDKLLFKVCEFEAKRLELFLLRIPFGYKLNLEPVINNPQYMKMIFANPVDIILEKYFKDEKLFEVYGPYEEVVCITETGKNFHREDCPYCNNSDMLYEIKQSVAINYGLEPCTCILKRRNHIDDMEKNDPNCMTVYVDESNRLNPWSYEGKNGICTQGSYSYYICKGNQSNESRLEDIYIVDKGTGSTDGSKGTTYITNEAIAFVLFKLKYKFSFDRNVKIYTDNQSVAESWRKDGYCEELSKLFQSVEILYVPRNHNKLADAIGREVSVLDVPTDVYNEILYKCMKYDEISKLATGLVAS